MNLLSGLPEGADRPAQKRCPQCGGLKPLSEFPKNRIARSGLANYCKPCHNAISRRNRERIHGTTRNYMLKHRYGIRAEQLDAMLTEQKGVCAICQVRSSKHVDHDHASAHVRGLLCFRCNGALGRFDDDAAWLTRAASYLDKHTGQFGDDPEVIRRAIVYVERWQNPPDAVHEPAVPYILSVA